ncbi:hypothetical protein B0H11DRAFT_2410407 [Mycena galericulata]|nr:hypothetical protein B0H11DRAFT_2410407 [Mycena galericulata]
MARTRSDDTQESNAELPTTVRVRAGMTPAGASALQFETGFRGEADDEGREEAAARQRRRENASDVWVEVDIPFGSVQARHIGGQDTEMGQCGSKRRCGVITTPDPDLASGEVAQVLAAKTMGGETSPVTDTHCSAKEVVLYQLVASIMVSFIRQLAFGVPPFDPAFLPALFLLPAAPEIAPP